VDAIGRNMQALLGVLRPVLAGGSLPKGEGPRCDPDRLPDQRRLNTDPRPVDTGACGGEQIAGLSIQDMDAGTIQALQRSVIELLDLPVAQDPKERCLFGGFNYVHP
jgi:hypothetical protein